MADELTFPVAYCETCKEAGPVVVQEFPAEELEQEFVAIYCPGCEQVINLINDVKVEWYSQDEVAKVTGWKVVDGE